MRSLATVELRLLLWTPRASSLHMAVERLPHGDKGRSMVHRSPVCPWTRSMGTKAEAGGRETTGHPGRPAGAAEERGGAHGDVVLGA